MNVAKLPCEKLNCTQKYVSRESLITYIFTKPVDNMISHSNILCHPGHKMRFFPGKCCIKLTCFLWSEGE
jgi:hypothetical protein